MNDKNLKFILFSTLISIISISLIIGAFFIDNKNTQLIVILIALGILILQKITEIIIIKQTRKISVAILIALIVAIYYIINR